MHDTTVSTARIPPEAERIAHLMRLLRAEYSLSVRRVAAALRTTPARIHRFENGADPIPTVYAGGLVQLCGASVQALTHDLFAPADWPTDPARFDPLPASPTVMEIALRLARHEPAAEPKLRRLLAIRLAHTEPPSRIPWPRLRDHFRNLYPPED